MKNKILLPVVAASVAFVTGCGTNAHYVQSGGTQSIVNIGQINIQDYMQAADDMTGELLASGVLDKVDHPPALLAISRIVNNTGEQIDTDLLTKRIRVALLKSGKAQFTTTFGLGGTAEDPLAQQMQQSDQTAALTPQFTLAGKIIQLAVKAGDTSQSTFEFQLSLTNPKTGVAVWEDLRDITKQGTRAGVGF
jgi:uncharacterized protein (TIGR02722 family)